MFSVIVGSEFFIIIDKEASVVPSSVLSFGVTNTLISSSLLKLVPHPSKVCEVLPVISIHPVSNFCH